MNRASSSCCPPAASRRDFLKTATLTGMSLGALPIIGQAEEEKSANDGAETLVTQLFKSFTEEQKKMLHFPFDDPKRSKVDNNWQIVPQVIADALNRDQQDLVRQIFLSIHSEEYAEKVLGQVTHDSEGEGFEKSCSVAIFGEPGTGKFEFVLTGRHCTRRCDGDSVAGAAFGGPIFYGHAAESFYEEPDHKGNVYWYQAKRANEVFKALDGKQQEKALCAKGRPEQGTATVKLKGKAGEFEGLALADMSKDQVGLVEKVLADLLAPFRQKDADEALKMIKDGGMEKMHIAFYKEGDLGDDKVWDVWQLESPNMLWHFRGSPHVHCWANIVAPDSVA